MSDKNPYRPRKKPKQDRAKITRDAILEAAAHILAEGGYPALNTNKIARRAGVSIGSLYQYFPNKEAVVASLIEQEVNKDRDFLEALFADVQEASLEEAVRLLIDAVMDRCEADLILAVALREQIPRVEWTGKMREATSYLEAALLDLLRTRFPETDGERLRQSAFIVVRAVDGIVNAALFDHPEWLSDEDFRKAVAALVTEHLAPRNVAS